ncbi:BrnT family toxin [Dyadobacter pollutisoli]|uniref:BrnT family toxin n=1 Tax=Dyadobacter pollutisoli TaxID=2910158 RepID=A0A9E8N7X5_9BACT|nr:BrnT family toxin [Dyadobacter pollutisoli]WAC09549.1 BrnT family toxin [Dyadobacter pollutisoli]
MAPLKFDWDGGNLMKSVDKHLIENVEAESMFDDPKKLVIMSQRSREIRYLCIAKSNRNRLLSSYFIIRNGKVRIIGTRVARKSEKQDYEDAND